MLEIIVPQLLLLLHLLLLLLLLLHLLKLLELLQLLVILLLVLELQLLKQNNKIPNQKCFLEKSLLVFLCVLSLPKRFNKRKKEKKLVVANQTTSL